MNSPQSLNGFFGPSGNTVFSLLSVAVIACGLIAAPEFLAGRAGQTTVWAWGYNSDGELGNGSTTRYGGIPTPGPVQNLGGALRVTGGNSHSVALAPDGTVWTWGNDGWGQLGNPATPYTSSTVPIQVNGLTGVTAVAAGWAHTLALKSDGTVWGWGYNYYGQVGVGTSGNNILTPTRVRNLTNVVAIAAGSGAFHSMALKSDGTVWTWGYDGLGQLGNGTANETAHPLPVRVTALSGITAIAAGGNHDLAVTAAGTVWAWGSNQNSQLGTTTTATCSSYHYPCSPIPVQVRGFTGATAVAAGNDFSLAVKTDQTAWGWGGNGYGQLGNGRTNLFGGVVTPTKVSGLTGVIGLAAGSSHSLAVTSAGAVWAWGYNGYGQLGNGATDQNPHPTPAQVSLPNGMSVAGAGQNHSLAF